MTAGSTAVWQRCAVVSALPQTLLAAALQVELLDAATGERVPDDMSGTRIEVS